MPEQIPGSRDVSVGINDTLTVVGNSKLTVGESISSSTRVDQTLTAGKHIVVQAGDSLELVCGDARIMMKKDGSIVISGKDITIAGTGKVNVKASQDVVIKGRKLQQN